MIDLTTSYMGLKLKNPLVVSASPLGQDLNAGCRCCSSDRAKVESATVGQIVTCLFAHRQVVNLAHID